MEEAFLPKIFFSFGQNTGKAMPGIDATRAHGAHPFGVADDELVEEAVNGVHEEHEGKGQHKEHAENNQRTVNV